MLKLGCYQFSNQMSPRRSHKTKQIRQNSLGMTSSWFSGIVIVPFIVHILQEYKFICFQDNRQQFSVLIDYGRPIMQVSNCGKGFKNMLKIAHYSARSLFNNSYIYIGTIQSVEQYCQRLRLMKINCHPFYWHTK